MSIKRRPPSQRRACVNQKAATLEKASVRQVSPNWRKGSPRATLFWRGECALPTGSGHSHKPLHERFFRLALQCWESLLVGRAHFAPPFNPHTTCKLEQLERSCPILPGPLPRLLGVTRRWQNYQRACSSNRLCPVAWSSQRAHTYVHSVAHSRRLTSLASARSGCRTCSSVCANGVVQGR